MLRTRVEILNYLNKSILYWRKIANDKNHEDKEVAWYYLDAFTSIKEAIFGKTKE